MLIQITKSIIGSLLILSTAFMLGSCERDYKNENSNSTLFSVAGDIIPNGWLNELINQEINGVTAHLDEIAPEIGRNPFIHNKIEGETGVISWWDGESYGNWIDGVIRLSFIAKDSALLNKTETWVNQIIEKQQQDKEPYMGLYHQDGIQRWKSALGELWPQSRVYLALLEYYRVTNDSTVLNAVKKAADLTIKQINPKSHPDLQETNINLHLTMITEPMVMLYSITGDKKYYDYAYEISSKHFSRIDNMLAGEKYMHGVQLSEFIRVPALLGQYKENGSHQELIEKSLAGVDYINKYFVQAHGGIRSDEAVSYARPNRGTEYCTITEWFLSLTEVARIAERYDLLDAAEKVFFNAAMGARLPSGNIQYQSFPNQLYVSEDAWFHGKNKQISYGPNHWPLCCNPNAGRLIPYYISRMWLKTPSDGLYAALYGPSTLRTTIGQNNDSISIQQKTNYPFENKVTFLFETEKPISAPISFRIPQWCRTTPVIIFNRDTLKLGDNGFSLINGQTMVIKKEWSRNDSLTIYFPRNINVKTDVNDLKVIEYGPLVFSAPVEHTMIKNNEQSLGFSYYDFLPNPNAIWNYGLVVKTKEPSSNMKVIELKNNTNDFVWSSPSIGIQVLAHRHPNWELNKTGPVPMPLSPLYPYMVNNADVDTILLVPYGTTRNRITCFPYYLDYIP
jgi:uncharacterized protein